MEFGSGVPKWPQANFSTYLWETFYSGPNFKILVWKKILHLHSLKLNKGPDFGNFLIHKFVVQEFQDMNPRTAIKIFLKNRLKGYVSTEVTYFPNQNTLQLGKLQ